MLERGLLSADYQCAVAKKNVRGVKSAVRIVAEFQEALNQQEHELRWIDVKEDILPFTTANVSEKSLFHWEPAYRGV